MTIKSDNIQIGANATATQNFVLKQGADGTCTLARGNIGATTQDVLTVDASGNINAPVAMQQGGIAMGRMVLATAQATTSGTSIDFTSIPSWTKRITVMFNGVSTNGTSVPIIQLGAGSVDATSYLCSTSGISASAVGTSSTTTGFGLSNSPGSAAYVAGGSIVLNLLGSNIWTVIGSVYVASAVLMVVGGQKTLGGALDRIRLTTVNGTDTFDAGSVNIMYEG